MMDGLVHWHLQSPSFWNILLDPSPFCFNVQCSRFLVTQSLLPAASSMPPRSLASLELWLQPRCQVTNRLTPGSTHPCPRGSLAIASSPSTEESEFLCSSVLGPFWQGCPWEKRGHDLGMHPSAYASTEVDQEGTRPPEDVLPSLPVPTQPSVQNAIHHLTPFLALTSQAPPQGGASEQVLLSFQLPSPWPPGFLFLLFSLGCPDHRERRPPAEIL